ncbi:MAG: hypothetical protein K2G78_04760, partial [Muribaculaceae bacterium]|nr:hypothetical protein [Muribaculaceae bacterium]
MINKQILLEVMLENRQEVIVAALLRARSLKFRGLIHRIPIVQQVAESERARTGSHAGMAW